MVSPYQVWMLGRLADAMAPAFDDPQASGALQAWLADFADGAELLALPARLSGCRLRKALENLYPA